MLCVWLWIRPPSPARWHLGTARTWPRPAGCWKTWGYRPTFYQFLPVVGFWNPNVRGMVGKLSLNSTMKYMTFERERWEKNLEPYTIMLSKHVAGKGHSQNMYHQLRFCEPRLCRSCRSLVTDSLPPSFQVIEAPRSMEKSDAGRKLKRSQ